MRQPSEQQSILLSDVATNSVLCLRDDYDTPFVGLEVDGTIQVHEASISILRGYLAEKYFQKYHDYPTKRLLDSMAETLKSRCLVSPKVKLEYRVCSDGDNGSVHYDLGAADWGSLEVGTAGFSYHVPSKVYFRRTSGMDALPMPIEDPDKRSVLDLLQLVAPLSNSDQELLRLGFLLSCLWPNGPYPILNLYGPPESGKGFHSKVIRRIVDPVSAPLQGFPAHEHELLLDANNQRLIVLDNISKLPGWGANALCRISTGGSFRRKRLYTDASVIVFHVSNPVLINSVDQVVTAPDLVSRAMFLDFPSLPDKGRLDEQDMLQVVDRHSPYIMFELFKIISEALKTPDTVETQSRITPTFRLMAVAERLLSLGTGAFSRAYYRNRSLGHDAILSEYAYISAVRDLLAAQEGTWEGTAKELLTTLNNKVKAALRGENWPTSAHALTRQLKGMSTSLQDVGFHLDLNTRQTRLGQVLKISKTRG